MFINSLINPESDSIPDNFLIFLFSSLLNACVNSTAPSEPPRNFSIKHSTESELTFQLKPVDKYHINGVLRGYKVTYGKSNSPNHTWTTLLINATHNRRRKRSTENETLGFILTNLESYTTYTVTVLAFTVKDGVPTLAANFTTAQDGITPLHLKTNES